MHADVNSMDDIGCRADLAYVSSNISQRPVDCYRFRKGRQSIWQTCFG
jgi:hypothetical protein